MKKNYLQVFHIVNIKKIKNEKINLCIKKNWMPHFIT